MELGSARLNTSWALIIITIVIIIVITDVKDIDSGNVDIRDGDADNRDEGTGSTGCTDGDAIVASTRSVDERENVNHTGTPRWYP